MLLIIARQRLHRRLVRHDHLHQRDPLDPAAPVLCRPGRRRRRARHRPPRHAAGDPLAAQLRHPLPGALAAGELRVHLADHRRRAVLRHHGLRALRLPARLRQRPVRLWRGAGARAGRRSASPRRCCSGASWTCARCCSGRGSRCHEHRRAAASPTAPVDWQALAARARVAPPAVDGLCSTSSWRSASLPILVPYLWLVTVAFSGRTGASTLRALAHARGHPAGAARSGSIAAASSLDDRAPALGASSLLVGGAALALLAVADRPVPASRQLALPVEPRHRRHAQGRLGRRHQVPERLDRVRQLAGPGAGRRWRSWSRSARSPATTSRASTSRGRAGYLQGPAGPARLPGDDADHPDLPDDVLDRPARHAHRRRSWCRRARAAVRDLRHEGLLRRRALGHRDERHDRRRLAPAGVPLRRPAAGQGRHAGDRHLRLPARLGGVRLRPHAAVRQGRTGR